MFLILDQKLDKFSLRLREIAEHKGLETVFITSAELVHNVLLVFHIAEQGCNLYLRYRDKVIRSSDIEGVYCGIDIFEPALWKYFAPKDAEYAARETQALWLAILTSLPCRVVNPPAFESLAGTLLSTPEIFYLAHQMGFDIPMMINLESGKIAAEVLRRGVPAYYADLGEMWINETKLIHNNIPFLEQNENHFQVVEEIPGKPIHISLVGDRFFACEIAKNGLVYPIDVSKIPYLIKTRLRTLHKRLNLKLAEYFFRIMVDGTWVFVGYIRKPLYAITAYGDVLFEKIIDYIVKRRK